MVVVWVWLCCLVAVVAQTHDNPILLTPDVELQRQIITQGNPVYYKLPTPLSPNSFYEIRVSYLATTPAHFMISFVGSYKTRELLNIEKLMFTTDEHGVVQSGSDLVRVEVVFAGLPAGEQLSSLEYNIVLETLFFGVPFEVFKIGVLVALGLIIVSIIMPQLITFLVAIRESRQSHSHTT